MRMRTCSVCKNTNNTRQNKCRDCYNAYMNTYMRERWQRRRSWGIARLGGKCVDCGTIELLQFDHVDPEAKNFTLAKQSSCSELRFLEEIAKCVLRCKWCHIERTRAQQTVGHGGGGQGITGCKCKLCKDKKSEYNRIYYRNTSSTKALTAEDPLAQQVERRPFKSSVQGSSPWGITCSHTPNPGKLQ